MEIFRTSHCKVSIRDLQREKIIKQFEHAEKIENTVIAISLYGVLLSKLNEKQTVS